MYIDIRKLSKKGYEVEIIEKDGRAEGIEIFPRSGINDDFMVKACSLVSEQCGVTDAQVDMLVSEFALKIEKIQILNAI